MRDGGQTVLNAGECKKLFHQNFKPVEEFQGPEVLYAVQYRGRIGGIVTGVVYIVAQEFFLRFSQSFIFCMVLRRSRARDLATRDTSFL